MNLSDYLLRNVSEDEFAQIAVNERKIIKEARERLNGSWRSRTKDMKVNFKYNPGRKMIGIYLHRDGTEELIAERAETLSDEESALVGSVYDVLERRLSRLMLPKERWISATDYKR